MEKERSERRKTGYIYRYEARVPRADEVDNARRNSLAARQGKTEKPEVITGDRGKTQGAEE